MFTMHNPPVLKNINRQVYERVVNPAYLVARTMDLAVCGKHTLVLFEDQTAADSFHRECDKRGWGSDRLVFHVGRIYTRPNRNVCLSIASPKFNYDNIVVYQADRYFDEISHEKTINILDSWCEPESTITFIN